LPLIFFRVTSVCAVIALGKNYPIVHAHTRVGPLVPQILLPPPPPQLVAVVEEKKEGVRVLVDENLVDKKNN
jgi:hypothetical protein